MVDYVTLLDLKDSPTRPWRPLEDNEVSVTINVRFVCTSVATCWKHACPEIAAIFDKTRTITANVEEAIALNLDPIIRFPSRDLVQVRSLIPIRPVLVPFCHAIFVQMQVFSSCGLSRSICQAFKDDARPIGSSGATATYTFVTSNVNNYYINN